MEYVATLTINGVQEVKVIGDDKSSVMTDIMHYASLYLDDGFESYEIEFRTKKDK